MSEETKKDAVETKTEGAPAEAQAPTNVPPKMATTDSNAPKTPDLNVNDLNSVRSIIGIATTRGAFKANELEAVGKTYNKLTAFLDHVTKQQQEQQGEANG